MPWLKRSTASAARPECYTWLAIYAMIEQMKKSLLETNPYLLDPAEREKLFYVSVCSSTAIEGVKVTFPPTSLIFYPGQVPPAKRTDDSSEPHR
jgi:hypothetical protein